MNTKVLYTGIAVVLAVIVVALFFFFPNYLHGVENQNQNQGQGQNQSPAQSQPSSPDSLQIQDVTLGAGAAAQPGDTVVVQYIGQLSDGTIFDQSSAHTEVMPGCDTAQEFCFQLGAGQVIPGWDQGLVGMQVGGERKLVIPPSLGYGSNQVGPIPPNSTLTFDIKLLNVKTTSSSTPFVPTGSQAN